MLNNNFNPYMNQLQQLQQRYDNMQQQPQQPQNKVVICESEDIAKNTQIMLDGSITVFIYGDTVLTRKWNVANSCVENKYYKLSDSPVEKKEDRLKVIEEKLDEILRKQTYPINRKKDKDVE